MITMYPAEVNSPATTLASGINAVVDIIPLVDSSVLPAAPNLAGIGTGEDTETILYEVINGNNLETVTRGFQGTAKGWDSGTAVARLFTAYDHDTFKANLENHDVATTGVHGVGGGTVAKVGDIAVDANLSVAAQDAIAKKHTQGTDTALGAVGTKDPPIDADKALYRNSAAADALVTSTWTQIKAFLRTYFDTLYSNLAHRLRHQNGGADEINVGGLSGELADDQPPKAHASNHTDGTDDVQDATAGQKGLATAAQITKLNGIEAGATADQTAAEVEVAELGAATYDDVQDFINQFGNRTHISGLVISDALDGTANISAGTGWCKVSDSLNAEGKFFDFAGGASDDVSGALTDLAVNYIYLDYNGGTPQIVHDTTGSLFYDYDHIVLGCVYRHGTHLHLINSNYAGLDAAHQIKMRAYEAFGPGNRTSGLVTTGTGTRNLAISAGVIWTGLTRTVTLSFDTSSVDSGTADDTEANTLHDADGGFSANDVGKTVKNTTDTTYTHVIAFVDSGQLTLEDDIFVSGENYELYDSWNYWYYDGDLGTPAWVNVEHSTQISRTQYNALASGLANLGANKYGVHWVYMDAEGRHLHIVYGQGNYTAPQAEAASIPASLPPVVTSFSSIIAKIICQEGTDTLTISYPWTIAFTSSLAQDHGNLAGLADDDHPQYLLVTDLENPPTEDEASKAPTSEWAFDHDADVDAHHAQAHKDTHDPEDGGDPLDAAAASEIAGVQAAAEGSAHELTRADHAHQIQHGIVDNHLVTIDQADAADDEYVRMTADGIESRSAAEVKTDLGFITSPLVADLNFAEYKAIALVCDNGATAPAAPTKGQWFLHTPTGRNVLMQYDGSNWIEIISLGTMTMYVDTGNGSDAIDKGYGTTTNAFATFQYAFDRVPPLYSGNITIHIAPGSYAETATLQGKTPTGDYTITIDGNMTTLDSLTADAGCWQGAYHGIQQHQYGTVIRNADTWTADQRENKWLRFTSGSNDGETNLIDRNTTTKAIMVDKWIGAAPADGDTFIVEEPDVIITLLQIGKNQQNVIVNDIKITPAAGTHQAIFSFGSESVWNRCWFVATGTSSIWAGKNSETALRACYIDSFRMFVRAHSKMLYQGSKGYKGAYGRTLQIDEGGILYLGSGTVIDGGDVASSRGIYLIGLGLSNSNAGYVTQMRLTMRNCVTGIDIGLNSVALATTMTYTLNGNTKMDGPSEQATATSANKLVDTSVNFTALGIAIDDKVINFTDQTAALVTAIDSATQLSLDTDIMAINEYYQILDKDTLNTTDIATATGGQYN